MRKMLALLMMIILLCAGGAASAWAQQNESGVTILKSPDRLDLYRAYENVFYSGSIRYRLDEDAVVTKHSITQHGEAMGFEMTFADEGNGVYRVDLHGGFDLLKLEIDDLLQTKIDAYTYMIPVTFTVETKKGAQSVSFPVYIHQDSWDSRHVDLGGCVGIDQGDFVLVGEEVVVRKPTFDGAGVKTGLLNDALYKTDAYFGSGWVNDFSYTTDTLELVRETNDAFILRAIAPGVAETISTVRKVNTNLSISVVTDNFRVKDEQTVGFVDRYHDIEDEARFLLQDGSYTSKRMAIEVQECVSDPRTLDAEQLHCEARIIDPDIVSEVTLIEARPSYSSPRIILQYELSGVKKAGVTQLEIDVTYRDATYTAVIPVVVCDSSIENDPYTPAVSFDFAKTWYYGDVPSFHASGADADEYSWSIDCAALGINGVIEKSGIYPVTATLYSEQKGYATRDLGMVTVKARGEEEPTHNNARITLSETWSDTWLGGAYCSELDKVIELDLGAYGKCFSGAENHDPHFDVELIGVSADCPYTIEIDTEKTGLNHGQSEDSYGLDPYAWVTMTPKTMPLATGNYTYAVKYTVTCCGETASIIQNIPLLIVEIPRNKEDYLVSPPKYMCLDRDEVIWDDDVPTPLNRYCEVELSFESGAEVWEEEYFKHFRLYRPTEEGTAKWKYVGKYANGEVELLSGETEIFPRDEYLELDQNTCLTAAHSTFNLTTAKGYVPPMFSPGKNGWTEKLEGDGDWGLKSQIVTTDAENAVCYELTLVDDNDNEQQLPESAALLLPYPDGMTAEEAEGCEFVVVHESENGTEIYSTQDGTILRTEYGLEIVVDSLSPFTINWGTQDEMNALVDSYDGPDAGEDAEVGAGESADTSVLPKTGDDSALGLWLALLAAAGAALCMLRRKIA